MGTTIRSTIVNLCVRKGEGSLFSIRRISETTLSGESLYGCTAQQASVLLRVDKVVYGWYRDKLVARWRQVCPHSSSYLMYLTMPPVGVTRVMSGIGG